MSLKQFGGVFGRNPTFNDVTIEGDLILNGDTFTGLDYQGTWNASTNTPALTGGSGTTGEFYIVNVAGATDLDGITNWAVGDWAMFNGTAWQRVEGGANGNFVDLSASGNVTLSGGTANGVLYLDGSKVATSGSALTFDGTNFGVGGAPTNYTGYKTITLDGGSAGAEFDFKTNGTLSGYLESTASIMKFHIPAPSTFLWAIDTEQMRLNSTGLGIGTSSPGNKLHVSGSGDVARFTNGSNSAYFALDSAGFTLFTGAAQTGNGLYAKASDNSLQFWTSSNSKMVIDSSGNVGIGTSSPAVALDVSGAIRASTGILFGSDTAAANTLDDYEEGTWTATLKGSTTDPTTPVTTTGLYTRVGRLVTITASFDNVDTTGAAGDVTVTGIPFNNSTPYTRVSGVVGYLGNFPITNKYASCAMDENATAIYFNDIAGTGYGAALQHSAGAGRYLRFEMTYYAA